MTNDGSLADRATIRKVQYLFPGACLACQDNPSVAPRKLSLIAPPTVELLGEVAMKYPRYYLASPWATTVAYRAIPFVAVRSASCIVCEPAIYLYSTRSEFKKKGNGFYVYDDIKELSVNNSVWHNWHLQLLYSGAVRLLIATRR